MILKKITLSNIGAYHGIQSIDLTPSKGKPIILIGGMNGAGKTTLLNAIRTCLFGKRIAQLDIATKSYQGF